MQINQNKSVEHNSPKTRSTPFGVTYSGRPPSTLSPHRLWSSSLLSRKETLTLFSERSFTTGDEISNSSRIRPSFPSFRRGPSPFSSPFRCDSTFLDCRDSRIHSTGVTPEHTQPSGNSSSFPFSVNSTRPLQAPS